MRLTYLGILLALFLADVLCYIEHVEISGCETCTLRLTCRHFDSTIAILETTFELEDNRTYAESLEKSAFPPVHPRSALNKRCSGVNHCSFILTKDCPGADLWGTGNLTIKFVCVADSRITKHCNKDIHLPSVHSTSGVSQGFIHTPGYPRFYFGKVPCRWRIHAPPLQRLKITIMDLSLLENPSPGHHCTDLLEVHDGGSVVYSSCSSEEPPTEINSMSNSLEAVLVTSPEVLVPRRGVLLYYTAVGCPTPRPPADGYLVFRNDTVAEFMCCVGFVFPDIRKRMRFIRCLGYRWDVPLPIPDCTNKTLYEDPTVPSAGNVHIRSAESPLEVVIPILLIVMLLAVNSVVLLFILRCRHLKEEEELKEEELKSLSMSIT